MNIKKMVDRFLQWKLPGDFAPDNGITFQKKFNEGTPHEVTREPVGTNLFTATQAEAMIRYLVADQSQSLDHAPSQQERRTFVVPAGHEAVRDAEGRATGETRLIPPSTATSAEPVAWQSRWKGRDWEQVVDPTADHLQRLRNCDREVRPLYDTPSPHPGAAQLREALEDVRIATFRSTLLQGFKHSDADKSELSGRLEIIREIVDIALAAAPVSADAKQS